MLMNPRRRGLARITSVKRPFAAELAAISHTDRFCGGRWILAGVESDERLAICSAIGSAGVSKG